MSKRNPQRIYVYERKRKDKAGNPLPSFWYARFRGENGKMGSPLCTDQPDRASALRWANEEVYDHGTPKAARKPKGQSFAKWAEPWWLFDSCPYVKYKQTRGFSISRVYVEGRRSYLAHHLIPEFGDKLMSELRPLMFRNYSLRLAEEGVSPSVINKILGTAKIMLTHAYTMGEIDTNPMIGVGDMKESPKRRGILSPDELRRLFFSPAAKERVWKGEPRHYTINLLAASTGMRAGECRALRVQDINFEEGYVDVLHSWSLYGLTPPKWKSERIIPLIGPVQHAISELLGFRRWGDPQPTDFVFWGATRERPLTQSCILSAYKRALIRIGIKAEEQQKRNLLFHSWRHGYNSWLRGKVPEAQLRRVTGHKSMIMSDNYDHVRAPELADVRAAVEKLLTSEAQEELVAGIRAPREQEAAGGAVK